MKRKSIRSFFFATVLSLTAGTLFAVDPCCTISGFDPGNGIVIAKVTAGKDAGTLFKFKVSDDKLFKTLKSGQAVYADFTKGRVSLKEGVQCCDIVGGTRANTNKITTVNAATGVISTFDPENGKRIQIKLNNSKLLAALKVGQAIDVIQLGNGNVQVRVAGFDPGNGVVVP